MRPAVVTETPPDPDVDGAILGACPAMREVYKGIGRVAGQDVTVLIAGETGTGKEMIARASSTSPQCPGQGAVHGSQLRRHP